MTAVGYTSGDPRKVDVAGDTMTGGLVLPGDPSTALEAATKRYVDNAVASGGGGGAVTSVDGKTGAVDLSGSYATPAQVDSAVAAAFNQALPLTGGTITGNLTIDAAGSAFAILDRGANTNFAGFQFATGGVTKASVGTRNDGTEDVHVFLDGADAGRQKAVVFKPNSETVFNEEGGDQDLRVEGDTDANLLMVDASTDRVGIGTATPSAKLDVNGGGQFAGTVDLGSNKLTSVADPTSAQDAATKAYADSLVGAYPSDLGFKAWISDPGATTLGSQNAVSGRLYLSGIFVRQAMTVSTLWWVMNVQGSSLTAGQCFIGLYASDGTLLGSAAIEGISGVGPKSASIGSQSLTPGMYWVAWLWNFTGSTAPAATAGLTLGNGRTMANGLLTASQARFAYQDSFTALPNPLVPANNQISSGTNMFCLWAAMS